MKVDGAKGVVSVVSEWPNWLSQYLLILHNLITQTQYITVLAAVDCLQCRLLFLIHLVQELRTAFLLLLFYMQVFILISFFRLFMFFLCVISWSLKRCIDAIYSSMLGNCERVLFMDIAIMHSSFSFLAAANSQTSDLPVEDSTAHYRHLASAWNRQAHLFIYL